MKKIAVLCAGNRDVVMRLERMYRTADPTWVVLKKQTYRPKGETIVLDSEYFEPEEMGWDFDECVFPWCGFNANLVCTAEIIAAEITAVDVWSNRNLSLPPRVEVEPIPMTGRDQFNARLDTIRSLMAESPPPGDFSGDGFQRKYPIQVERSAIYGAALERFQGVRVVDIGCGLGWGTALLAQYCPDVVGVDINEPILEYNRQTFRGASFQSKAPDYYPAATLIEFLEHIPQPQEFLCGLTTHRVFVSVPDARFYPIRGAQCPAHIHDFQPHDVANLMERAGYHPEFIGYPTVIENDLGPWEPSDFGLSTYHTAYSGPSALFFGTRP